MKRGLLRRIVVILGTVVVLAGCGNSSVSSRAIDTDTYLFYTPIDSAGTNQFGLTAVDPSNPSVPIPITYDTPNPPSTFMPVYFLAGNVDATNRTISDIHYRYVVYSDGTNLYRVSAPKDEGLRIAEISSESAAANICGLSPVTKYTWGFTDYKNPLKSVFIYREDPDASNCATTPSNDSLYSVQLDTDSGTPPNSVGVSTAEYPIAPVYNTDGSINSILMWSSFSGALTRMNINMTVAASLGTGNTIRPSVVAIDPYGRIMLALYGAWGIEIRVFDPSTMTLSAALHTSAAGTIPAFYASDGSYGYFHDNQVIYRAPFDASAGASVVADESGNFSGGLIRAGWTGSGGYTRIGDLHLSGNNLIYVYDDSSGATPAGTSNQVYVRSVPKSGGTPKTIYTFPDNAELLAWRSAAGRIYLSRYDVAQAVSVGDAGQSPELFDTSWWMGFTFDSTARLFAAESADTADKGRDLTAKTIFRTQYDPTDFYPAQLYSYDADTTAQLIDFGIPSPYFGTYGLGGPPDILGITTRDRVLIAFDSADLGGNPDTGILYLQARSKSSMVVASRNSPYNAALVGLNYGGGCSLGNGSFDPLLPALVLLSALYLWRRRKAWHKR